MSNSRTVAEVIDLVVPYLHNQNCFDGPSCRKWQYHTVSLNVCTSCTLVFYNVYVVFVYETLFVLVKSIALPPPLHPLALFVDPSGQPPN